MNVETQMQSRQVPCLYLALGLTQAAHSVEEVLTGLWKNLPLVTGWMHARLPFIPVKAWSGEGFAAANLVVVAAMLAFSPFPFQNHTWAWKVVRIVAVVELVNGVLHIIPAIVKGSYHSGVVSAFFLVILASVLLWSMRRVHGI